MALPFDRNSLDTAWQGQPCLANTTTGSIDLASLDYSAAGSPFIANNGPLNQSTTINSQDSIALLGEVTVSTSGGGGISLELDSGNGLVRNEEMTVVTTISTNLNSIDGAIDPGSLTATSTITLSLDANDVLASSDLIVIGIGSVSLSLQPITSICSVEPITLSLESVSISLDSSDGITNITAITLTSVLSVEIGSGNGLVHTGIVELLPTITTTLQPTTLVSNVGSLDCTTTVSLTLHELEDVILTEDIAVSHGSLSVVLSGVDAVAALDDLDLEYAVTLGLSGANALGSSGDIALTPTVSLSLDPTIGRIDTGSLGVTPGVVSLQLGALSAIGSSDGLTLLVYFKSNARATWGSPDAANIVFDSHDQATATFTLHEQTNASFGTPTIATAVWGTGDSITVSYFVDEHF